MIWILSLDLFQPEVTPHSAEMFFVDPEILEIGESDS